MRILLFILFSLMVCKISSTSFLDNSEGLCGNVPATCSNSVQKFGICCSRTSGARPTVFNNWCLACKSVCGLIFRDALVLLTPTVTEDANDLLYGL